MLVKTILLFQLLAGLALVVLVPGFERAKVTALWSDFKMFEARVRADDAGVRILNYGGENPNDSFKHLLERLRRSHTSEFSQAVGLLISIISASSIFFLCLRKPGATDVPSSKS